MFSRISKYYDDSQSNFSKKFNDLEKRIEGETSKMNKLR